ncbi:hypothetical protein AB9F29_12345 [Falsihalocynthiibacter sp. S25ZX9]|uniref:hypothetical protein n=1 Tax=Falsihalocynthiibacter sp. S25ZX9 TaxID=3240870 RepID=UPI00350FBA03
MAKKSDVGQKFNILIIGQNGRLVYEALLFVASLRASSPNFNGRVFVAEPQPSELWRGQDPRMPSDIHDALTDMGAEILPFENQYFGKAYPNGNKIEALLAMPKGENFVFFDTDTLVTGPLDEIEFDFDRPSASMKREGTWPEQELYGPGYTQTWKSLYDRFGLEFESTLDLSQPDEYWERYLYFNAGWFYFRCPHEFGTRFLEYALEIRDNAPEELVCQPLTPWLDQVALPLVIHSFGGGRPSPSVSKLDGETSCHYRFLPLLYAREPERTLEILEAVAAPNKLKKRLKLYDPIKRMIYQGRGRKARALFDQDNLPRREKVIRNTLRREGFWMR